MNELTLRQRAFIGKLLNEKSYKPIKYFSDILNVSDKTLQKDLKIIAKYLEEFNVELIKKKGYGVLISEDANQNVELLNNLNIKSNNNKITLADRRMEITKLLLIDSNKSTSIQKLSDKYYVSKASIVNDFKFIEEWISKYRLKLEKSKDGTRIVGSESNIRKSIAALIEELPNTENKKHNISDLTRLDIETLNSIGELFNIDSILFMESVILELEEKLDYTIVQPYYINLLTHMLILLKRVKDGNQIEDNIFVDKLNYNFDSIVYENVISLAEKIYEEYKIKINQSEVYYIYQYLISSRIRHYENDKSEIEANSKEDISQHIAKEMLEYMSDVLKIDFTRDTMLYDGICAHIRPMLNRLKYDIQIKNPLLEELKERYSDLLEVCEAVSTIILRKYNFKSISIDEVAYLATYFQVSIEKGMGQKRVMVVCHSGYGTSQLLTTRLKKKCPNLIIEDIISVHKLHKIDTENIDFIISTVNLDLLKKPYILVSALLTEKDIKNINNLLIK